ncbi:Krueppel-like factor 13 [Molossus molossus]|uniref:Krueppel-like factor 13 n=1 Tax=Molossus molossus TaxID=27622 RepID=UPI001746095D|nr:Krueppel-like factor 13 [Molossus molossus]
MAAAAYVDHFAAECPESTSSRAVVQGPREGPDPGPEGAAVAVAAGLPRVEERRDVKDSASLFVVARILADFNQQAPAPAPAERKEGASARKARTPCHLPPTSPPFHEPASPGGEGAAAAPLSPAWSEPEPRAEAGLEPEREPGPAGSGHPNLRQRGRRGRSHANLESPQRKHKCHYADSEKVYRKPSHLKTQPRTHTGRRPSACSWPDCSKKIARSEELAHHWRTHTGDKFSCPICGKRFMRGDRLTKHARRHANFHPGKLQRRAGGSRTSSLSDYSCSDVSSPTISPASSP